MDIAAHVLSKIPKEEINTVCAYMDTVRCQVSGSYDTKQLEFLFKIWNEHVSMHGKQESISCGGCRMYVYSNLKAAVKLHKKKAHGTGTSI